MTDTTPKTPSKPGTVQTTGHVWDGDLQEFSNPLPRWWLWAFYGTVLFSVLYWIYYPSWPVGQSWLKGIGTVDYSVVDKATGQVEEKEFRWNTRARLAAEMAEAESNPQRKAMLERVRAASFEDIAKDPAMVEFVRSVGKGLFGDNCAACHGSGGQGVAGLYPNLTDDDWLWGGSMLQIHETLSGGRKGYMPPYSAVLNAEQLDDVADYVLSLSDEVQASEVQASEASARGKAIFHGQVGGCYYCHGADAKGLASQGSANLTDKIWTIVNIAELKTPEQKKDAIKQFVSVGVNNTRIMPSWITRLNQDDIKLLTVYVHQLGEAQ